MVDMEKVIRDSRVRLCLDCGKCTAVCPVSRYMPEFNPRLIVQRRLNQVKPGRVDPSVWFCLDCHLCVERCNYHVKFPDFVRGLRLQAFAEGAQVQCSHGGALQALMRLMSHKDSRQSRLDWVPPDIKVAEKSDTLFFVGCAPYFDVLFAGMGVNTLDGVRGALKLLNNAGVEFQLNGNERCCGRDLLLQGDEEGFLALGRANVDEFLRRGVKKIITACPECYYTLRTDYPRHLGSFGVEVSYFADVLAPSLKAAGPGKDAPESKVTFHDPCTLGRGSRIFDSPRQLLNSLSGIKLVEMEQNRERSICCGASPWMYCGSVNRQIQEQRLAQAKATGAEVLVTACPKCQIHLRCAQRAGGARVTQIEIQDLAHLAGQRLDRR